MDISLLKAEEISRLWELYREECEREGATPDFSDFGIWLGER